MVKKNKNRIIAPNTTKERSGRSVRAQLPPLLQHTPAQTGASSFLLANALRGNLPRVQHPRNDAARLKEARRAYNEQRILDAARLIEDVLRDSPKNVQAMRLSAIVLRKLKKPKEALRILNKALKLAPDDKEIHNGLGMVHKELGNARAALKSYKKALEIDPNFAFVYNNIGALYREIGNFEEAVNSYRQALALDPALPESWSGMARSQKYRTPPPYLEELKAIAEQPFPDPIKRQAWFALGKICDDIGDYPAAYSYYSRANKAYSIDVDPQIDCDLMQSIQRAFSTKPSPALPRGKSAFAEPTPVFVLGMPRSGTTLVEQILDAHPATTCGGETHFFGEWTQGIQAENDAKHGYPDFVGELTTETLNSLRTRFQERFHIKKRKTRIIVDKTPFNYLYLGLIGLVFPEAKIIHCVRDDMDRGLSIFFNEFSTAYPFTTDLHAIGMYTHAYRELMAHWRKVSPLPILDVKYEALACDQERVTRDILEFCDLPWSDSCLEFYKSERLVDTPSDWQVRQPMFTSSIQRWRNYEAFLGPLRQALEHTGTYSRDTLV